MSSAIRKIKSTEVGTAQQPELIYREDRVNEFWESTLFNRVYLKHDIQDKIVAWKDEQYFAEFQDKIKNILNAYKGKEQALESMSERNLQNTIVKDILGALNWASDDDGPIKPFIDDVSFTYKEKTYKPDIIILDHPDDNQKVEGAKALERLNYARQCAKMVVEVKYWNRIEKQFQREREDKSLINKERQDDLSGIVSPNDQTIRYMDLLKLNWGILTDGTKWRLFNKDLSIEGSDRYYEFNFYKIFKAYNTAETPAEHAAVDEGLRYFFHFFSRYSFFPEDRSEPLVDIVLKDSKKYADKIEEDLKKRFLEAMNVACNALHNSDEFKKIFKDQSLNQESANSLLVNTAESVLFNIMFIKSLETRRVLPMASTDYKKLSLTSTLWKIEPYNPENSEIRNAKELERTFSRGNGNSFKYTSEGYELHDRMMRLINAIHKGGKKDDFGFEIAGFRETIFNDTEWQTFKSCKIQNKDWVNILFMLGYTQSETEGFRKYQQIPYEYFTPRQLGSIYESFLEFKLAKAEEDMIFAKGKWQSANLESEKVRKMDVPKVKKGKLFFTPNNAERKATGSYYTPDEVVQLIVSETLSPLVVKKTSDEILKLKVADTAMGSGHFLSGALTYLAQKYLEALKKEIYDDVRLNMQEAKQEVLHNCIFGVDINSRAVKLAKMSLWLESASANKKLEKLDGQIECFDSLLMNSKWEAIFEKINSKFDAVIGNPPYIRGKLLPLEYKKRIESEFVSTTGIYDIYVCFIELSKRLLNSSGRVGFITPSKFGQLDFGVGIRKFISEYLSVEKFIDFSDHQVFADATTYTAITILSNSKQNPTFQYCKFSEKQNDRPWLDELNCGLTFTSLPSNCLDIKSWRFTKNDLKKSSVKTIKLSEVCEHIFQGLVLTPTTAFPVRVEGATSAQLDPKKVYEIVQEKKNTSGLCEGELLVPIIKSSNIYKEGISFDNLFAVFPYDNKDKFRLIKNSEMIKKYPHALQYLKKVRPELDAREKGRWAKESEWYQYSRVQNFSCHQRRKILVPGLAKEPRFVIDDGIYYTDQGSYGLILKKEFQYLESYILSVLNSEDTKNFIEETSPMLSGGYYNYQTKYLKDLDIPLLSEDEMIKIGKEYIKQMTKLLKKVA